MLLGDLSTWPVVGISLLIFFARVVDVSLGTMRIILVSRGPRGVAPLIGFCEILIWLVALGQVVQNLDQPINYLAYAGGYAAGTWLGLMLDEKLALGLLAVRIITSEDAEALIARLAESRFGVTSVAARGLKGRVRLIFTVVRRRDLRRLQELIRLESPEAFVSVNDVRLASEGYFAPSFSASPRLLELLRKK
ncbi:MAG: DUF5698 domain-containing protein [Thermoanaerobaculia bacterium]|nr:DUF5698 domain-containing protein [Thermoanaerobaculia bacterium]